MVDVSGRQVDLHVVYVAAAAAAAANAVCLFAVGPMLQPYVQACSPVFDISLSAIGNRKNNYSSLSTDAEADQFHGFLANHLGVLLFHAARV